MSGINGFILNTNMDLHPDWFAMAFVVVLVFKTTVEYSKKAIYSKKMAFFAGVLFVWSMLLTNHISKFLYFDF